MLNTIELLNISSKQRPKTASIHKMDRLEEGRFEQGKLDDQNELQTIILKEVSDRNSF